MTRALVPVIGSLVACLLGAGCESRKPEIQRDPERQRRVIEPSQPSERVRPLPPHAIRPDGVGPYRLRASLTELLDLVPKGPARIATLDLPGIVHATVLRTEDHTILIGGEPLGKASFIAVVGPDVARTESGIHVGSTREELVKALGGPLEELDRARDPRVIVPSGMRNARALVDADRIAAFVLTTEAEPPTTPGEPGGCERPALDADPVAPGSNKLPERPRFAACLATGETVTVDGEDILVKPTGSERTLAVHVPGLVFAAPIRTPGEPRDELVAISRIDDAQQRAWFLSAYRIESGRLVRSLESASLYQLTAETARWIGADLHDLDLYLEIAARPARIEVGGLLTTRSDDKIRDVVAISPVSPPRHAKSATPGAGSADAGISDGAESPDAKNAKIDAASVHR